MHIGERRGDTDDSFDVREVREENSCDIAHFDVCIAETLVAWFAWLLRMMWTIGVGLSRNHAIILWLSKIADASSASPILLV